MPSYGKASQKQESLGKALKEYFKKTYETVDVPYRQDAGSEKWYKISDDVLAQVKGNDLGIRFRFTEE